MKTSIKRFALFTSIFIMAASIQAGTLDDLEAEASKPKERSSGSSSHSSNDRSTSSGNSVSDQLSAEVAEAIVEITFRLTEAGFTLLAEGGENSLHRYANRTPLTVNGLYRPKATPFYQH